MPIINNMMGMGIVFLPGMMTGQILAGIAPLDAIKYQIAIMLGIGGAVTITVFLVTEFQERTTKDGSPYATMMLADKTGSIKAILWSYSPGEHRVAKDQFVEAKGVVGTYNNQLQLRLLALTPCPDEKVSVGDFLRYLHASIHRPGMHDDTSFRRALEYFRADPEDLEIFP